MKPVRLASARFLGAMAGLATAGGVSWATPDGNLVVTLVPALVVGAAVWGLVRAWHRRHEAVTRNS